jgi:hypothetical protein
MSFPNDQIPLPHRLPKTRNTEIQIHSLKITPMKKLNLIAMPLLIMCCFISVSFKMPDLKKQHITNKAIFARTNLEIIVQITGTPPIPFPGGTVTNAETGQTFNGLPLSTLGNLLCQTGDLLIVSAPEGIVLIETTVTADDITAGVKYINVTSSL